MKITTEKRLSFEAESEVWEAVRRLLNERRARQAAGPRTWTDLAKHTPGGASVMTNRRYADRRARMFAQGMSLEGLGELTVESLAKALDWPGAPMAVASLLEEAGIRPDNF